MSLNENQPTIPRKIVSLSVASVENTAATQCNWIVVALADDGSAWWMPDVRNEWDRLPDLPTSVVKPFNETL